MKDSTIVGKYAAETYREAARYAVATKNSTLTVDLAPADILHTLGRIMDGQALILRRLEALEYLLPSHMRDAK